MTEKRWDHAINWDDTFICDQCGEEFEPFLDSYCGHSFVESETCQSCLEGDQRSKGEKKDDDMWDNADRASAEEEGR